MSKLSAADRKKIPAKQFAGPGRSFPIEDKNHAKAAITGASRSYNVGNISEGEKEKIQAAARRKLAHVLSK